MDQCEHVERAVAPAVGLEETGAVVRPLNPQNPVVTQGEPYNESDGEGD